MLALTLLGAVAVGEKLPPVYQSSSSVVLLASRTASKPNGQNPYLSFSPSLTLAADVLSRELVAPATVRYLAFRGYGDPYTVALPTETTQTTGSVLQVTVTGGDRASVQHTLHGVTSEISSRLARMQSGVHRAGRIRVLTLSITPQPGVSMSHTARTVALVAGLGLMLSLGLPWLVDAQVTRQVRRAQQPLPELPADEGRWAADQGSTTVFPLLAGGRSRYQRDDDPGPA
jgi:hypothetical protein